jgi:hypothetical protein
MICIYYKVGKTQCRETATEYRSLELGATRLSMSGLFPPTKVVHYIFQNIMRNDTCGIIRDAPLAEATQLYNSTIIFYPENPVVM